MDISKANASLTLMDQRASKAQASLHTQAHKNHTQEADNEQSMNEKLADIAQKLNEQMDSLDTNVRFAYNDKMGLMYISVTEKSTGIEIRKIPNEEAMKLAEYFKDALGMIFDKES